MSSTQQQPNDKRLSGDQKVLIAFGALLAGAIAVISVFGQGDTSGLIRDLLSFLTPVIGTYMVILRMKQVGAKVDDTHERVNGRMDAALKEAKQAAYLKGLQAGQAQASKDDTAGGDA